MSDSLQTRFVLRASALALVNEMETRAASECCARAISQAAGVPEAARVFTMLDIEAIRVGTVYDSILDPDELAVLPRKS